ncbi:hypothetical protein D9M71_780380 [compost metagenome]
MVLRRDFVYIRPEPAVFFLRYGNQKPECKADGNRAACFCMAAANRIYRLPDVRAPVRAGDDDVRGLIFLLLGAGHHIHNDELFSEAAGLARLFS